MEYTHDLIVVGGGPAGMSAAVTAASCGLKALLIDEQARPGGQIYRNVTAVPPTVAALLGRDYQHGKVLTDQLQASGVEVRQGTMVWDVSQDLTLTGQQSGRSFRVRAPQLIAAVGAMERPSPIPGWTLPGVLNAGAAQIALKSASTVPAGRVVLAGGGPLLLLVACQLLEAGVALAGIVDTSPSDNPWRALAHLPRALGAPMLLAKGLRLLWQIRRAGVPVFATAENLRAQGDERVTALLFTSGGSECRIDADVVLLHHGVVPNTQLGRLLRIEYEWSDMQLAWQPRVDAWGKTSMDGFRIAGDAAGIGGALASEAGGALAALGAAQALGKLDAAQCERLSAPWRRRLSQQLRIRPFLDALYRPPEWLADPADDTIVCRCEEVTAGRIREMVQLGCQGPNQTKFFSRCGMGPCQGRMCGITVTQVLATALSRSPGEIGSYRIRAPLNPVPLGSIAALADSPGAKKTESGKSP